MQFLHLSSLPLQDQSFLLRWLYNDASKEIASPAAEIVTFSIESVYSKLAVDDLKKLVEKYKDNSAAMTIIRARVRSYLYNNYVEINDRKRIANALRFDEGNAKIGSNVIPKLGRKNLK